MKRKINLGYGIDAYRKGERMIKQYSDEHGLHGVEGFEINGHTISYANTGDAYAETLVMVSYGSALNISNCKHSLLRTSWGSIVELLDK